MVVIVLFPPYNRIGCDANSISHSTTSPLAFIDQNVKNSLEAKYINRSRLYYNKQYEKRHALYDLPHSTNGALYSKRANHKLHKFPSFKEFRSTEILPNFQSHNALYSGELKWKTTAYDTAKSTSKFSKPYLETVPKQQQRKNLTHLNNKDSNISITNQYNEIKIETAPLTASNISNSESNNTRHVTKVNFYDIETIYKNRKHTEDVKAIYSDDLEISNGELVTKCNTELTRSCQVVTHINRKIFIDNGEMIISTFRDSITESEGKWKTEAVEKCNLEETIDFLCTNNTKDDTITPTYLDYQPQTPNLYADTLLIQQELYKRANDLTSKTNEQYNISHDVGKQYIESQIAENSEDFSHEAFLDVVRSGIANFEEILLSPNYQKKPKSVNSKFVVNSIDSYKVIDSESIEKQCFVEEDGKEITLANKIERHKVIADGDLTNNNSTNLKKKNEQLVANINHNIKSDKHAFNVVANEMIINDKMKYSTGTFQMQNDHLDDWDSLPDRCRKIRKPYHKTQPSHPQKTSILIDRKDALTKRPLDFDREEETRKGETIKWLESHFGSESTSSSNDSFGDENKFSADREKTYFNITIKSNENPIIAHSLTVPCNSFDLTPNEKHRKFSNKNIGLTISREEDINSSNICHSKILLDDRHKTGLTTLNNKFEENSNQKDSSLAYDFIANLSQKSKGSLEGQVNLSMLSRSFENKELPTSDQYPLHIKNNENCSYIPTNLLKTKGYHVKHDDVVSNARIKSENLDYPNPIKFLTRSHSGIPKNIVLEETKVVNPSVLHRNNMKTSDRYNKAILSFEDKSSVLKFPHYPNLCTYQVENFTTVPTDKIKRQEHGVVVGNATVKSSPIPSNKKTTTVRQVVGNSILKLIRKFRSCKNEHKCRGKFKNRFCNAFSDNASKYCGKDCQVHKDVNTTYQKYNVIDSHIGSISLQSDYEDSNREGLILGQDDAIHPQPSQAKNLTSSLHRQISINNDMDYHYFQTNKQYYYLGENPHGNNLCCKENEIEAKHRNHLGKGSYNFRSRSQNSFNLEKPLSCTLDRNQKNKNHMSASNPIINIKYNSTHTLPRQLNDEFGGDHHTTQKKTSYNSNQQPNRKSKTVQFDKYSRSLNRHKSISVHNMFLENESNQMYKCNADMYYNQKYLPHSECNLSKPQSGHKSPITNFIHRSQNEFLKLSISEEESNNYSHKIVCNNSSPVQMKKKCQCMNKINRIANPEVNIKLDQLQNINCSQDVH